MVTNGILGSTIDSVNPMKNFSSSIVNLQKRLSENLDPSWITPCCPKCSHDYEQELAKLKETEKSSVAVHIDCYRSVKDSTGPWFCELCEDILSSRSSRGVPSLGYSEKPCRVAECSLCGGTTGAFHKSTDGQWVHALCVEWVLESTFSRGQVKSM